MCIVAPLITKGNFLSLVFSQSNINIALLTDNVSKKVERVVIVDKLDL